MLRYLRNAILFFVLICCLPYDGSAAEKKEGPAGADIPSLIESVRFSGPIRVCGHEIPHQIPQIRERLEKEMLLALWDRPQVILWMKRANRFFPILKEF